MSRGKYSYEVRTENDAYLVVADHYGTGCDKGSYHFYVIERPARYFKEAVERKVASFTGVISVKERINTDE